MSLSRGQRILRWLPLSPLGFWVLGISLFVYLGFAVPRVDRVLELVTLVAVAAVLSAVALVVFGALRASQSRLRTDAPKLIALEVGAGSSEALQLDIPVVNRFLILRFEAVSPQALMISVQRNGSRLVERLQGVRRAETRTYQRDLVVEDAFGLARIRLRLETPTMVRVLPSLGRARRLALAPHFSEGEAFSHPAGSPVGDRVEMRPYVPGDPLRLVLWKVYARTGQLVVRVPERSVSPARRVVAYLLAGQKDEASAAFARAALENELLGDDFLFGVDGEERLVSKKSEALSLLMRSGDFGGLTGSGLQRHRRTFEQADQLVFFAPPDGQWLELFKDIAASFRTLPTVIVGVDGVSTKKRWPVFMRPVEHSVDIHVSVIDLIADELARLADVKLYDRSQGIRLLARQEREAA